MTFSPNSGGEGLLWQVSISWAAASYFSNDICNRKFHENALTSIFREAKERLVFGKCLLVLGWALTFWNAMCCETTGCAIILVPRPIQINERCGKRHNYFLFALIIWEDYACLPFTCPTILSHSNIQILSLHPSMKKETTTLPLHIWAGISPVMNPVVVHHLKCDKIVFRLIRMACLLQV